MGRKKGQGEKEEEDKKEEGKEEEDEPIVKELKEVDDKYLEVEREYERELQALLNVYTQKQAPLLEERRQRLTEAAGENAEATGTPALKGFWLQALKNVPSSSDQIETWDEPVLEYLSAIKKVNLDPDDQHKGFKLSFTFVDNPYVSNAELWKEYHTQEASPYTGEIETKEIKASEISWKPGKDVTVEKVKKSIKGGGAKKAKQKAKERDEPRDSFFRCFFRNMEPEMDIPDDLDAIGEDSDVEEEELISMLMEHDHDMGCMIKDRLVPFAIRWYTGEAVPEGLKQDDDDDDDDEEEEEEEDDDDDDDDDEDDEPPRATKKSQAKKKSGVGGTDPAAKQEECKQQ